MIGHLPGFLGVLGDLAFAVHVRSKSNIAKLGKLLRPASGVVIQAPPFMNDQNARPTTLYRIVPSEKSLTIEIAIFVGNFLGLHRGIRRCWDGDHGSQYCETTQHCSLPFD